ncbi:MAG: tetratricopeptide repeat protein [Acidobacteriaceae bacterium]
MHRTTTLAVHRTRNLAREAARKEEPATALSCALECALNTALNTALQHHRCGDLQQAEQIYRQILDRVPDHADVLHLLGMVAFQSGDSERAIPLLRRAIALHPGGRASYYSNLGNLLRSQQKLSEEEACYRQSLLRQPGRAEVHLNLGHTLQALGKPEEALACYQHAMDLQPDLAEAKLAVATVQLLKGEFEHAWRGFEERWNLSQGCPQPREVILPRWNGEPLDKGRLLIWSEQEVGDEIQFAGLIPDVLAAGHRCALECNPRLASLFSRSFPEVEILSRNDSHRTSVPDATSALANDPAAQNATDSANETGAKIVVPFAAQIPSGSLPALFRLHANQFHAARSPYLQADRSKVSRLRECYLPHRSQQIEAQPLVGISWYTRNPSSGPSRSIPLAELASLLACQAIQSVSLQY